VVGHGAAQVMVVFEQQQVHAKVHPLDAAVGPKRLKAA
jgi:hypothetical protein